MQSQLNYSYEAALKEQAVAAKNLNARWLIFESAPVITIGRNADLSDLLVSQNELAAQNIQLLKVNRGGKLTYHGPGQLLGFPCGNLKQFTNDPLAVKPFMQKLLLGLAQFLNQLTQTSEFSASPCNDAIYKNQQKCVSIGLAFSREFISHGFAINLFPEPDHLHGFSKINPCGKSAQHMTTVYAQPLTPSQVQAIAEQLEQYLNIYFALSGALNASKPTSSHLQ